MLGSCFGGCVVEFLLEGKGGCVIGICKNEIVDYDIMEILGEFYYINVDMYCLFKEFLI